MQAATSGGGSDAVYVDKKKLRREHKRKMMVSYRKEKKKEQTHLKLTLHRLEQTLQSLTTRQTPGQSALPWKEIARALLDESTASQIEHRALRNQLERHTFVLRAMKRWVVENTSLARSPNPVSPSWRHSTLYSDGHTRALGKEWITLQMLHTTERMLMAQGFPETLDEIYSADVAFTEDEGNEYSMSW
ncbi:unnamed protein product [Aphanomyces euteiches]|nr:hypothetical protein Ae201684P_012887 [Aphanomyces euteiches]KAH9143815.1 hypothetical protein AeRB84_012203 [Aphanomyces euteiches]